MMQRFIVLACFFGLFWLTTASAEPVTLRSDSPEEYVVKRGDTLWDIAGHFLQQPARWIEIWDLNPQIDNPHLIYPGDIIQLSWVEGQPRLTVRRGGGYNRTPGPGGTVKLSPEIRAEPLPPAIPIIPVDAIKQFLGYPQVIERGELNQVPYVADFVGEHLIGGSRDQIYVHSITDSQTTTYKVVRPGKVFRDGKTREILGYEAVYIGDATLLKPGTMAKMELVRTNQEVMLRDRLLPTGETQSLRQIYPKAPKQTINGKIISVADGVSQIGQYQVVVLDRGANDGLERGDILQIARGGQKIRDPMQRNAFLTRPLESAGNLLVFQVYSRVSFALVMSATDALHVGDNFRNPDLSRTAVWRDDG